MNEMKQANVFFDRSYGYARAIVALIGGLLLVIWPEEIKNYCMYILGALILTIGIVNMVLSYTGKWKREKVPLLTLNSIVDIAFGLLLLIFPSFFINFIMFVFGLILLIFGLGDVVNLIRTSRIMRLPWTLYIGPAAVLILGVLMFFYPDKAGNWLFILFGAGLLLYSVSEFLSTYTIRRKMKDIT
ncbi:MAG TPA: DUF308 domain-containing protein [Candidatus Coprenecus stercoravium]|uniref:DUF308 domain-containing protein n=1 Tax=Candidatus Coprenecus stercoravium TaxID=2840735 RepID=A0A9D2GQZ6_9BACT|nr:DUF308 domain-containing protein [Candidatus Coprenecus stercoravium]